MKCGFCDKLLKTPISKKQHEIRCKSNPDAIKVIPSYGMKGKKGGNQFTKAKEFGLPKPKVTDETKKKISESNKNIIWTEERKSKHSIAMKNAVERYPESYTSSNRGRTKQIIVDGIKFQGKWELEFYNYCKKNNIAIERSNEWFEYTWNGTRKYFPDFYLPTFDLYIEIKGYETERDRAKWSAFPKKLRIIKKEQIQNIRKGCFVDL